MTPAILKKTVVVAGLLLAADLAFAAEPCRLNIEGNDAMKFNFTELKVSSGCTEVELTLKHTGKLPKETMGHNWVLTKTADMMPVANAGVAAGIAKDYLPAGDKRVIAHTKLVGGGQSTSVKFPMSKLTKGGDYTFFCSFPGHYGLMKGKFIVQ
jgi:azurin